MQRWIDSTVPAPVDRAPADDLVAVYLGQSHGSRAPENEWRPSPTSSAQDLWDYLGDFA